MPSAYDYLRDELLRRQRQPMDERLPDGSTVQDLLQRVQQNPTTQSAPSPDLDPTQMTRPRRVFEQPPQPGTAGRPRFNDPITYDTSGMPERRAHNYGAEPLDSAIKYRDALENWQPSGERSLGNTARGAGYGVLTAAQQNPGSAEAMIGGGIAGLLASLIKPSSKNWMRRGLAIPQADAEVARQMKIAGEQAKLRQAEVNPYLREIGLNQGQQRIDLNRDRMAQQNLLAHRRALASIFNSYPEFDPDDPKNAAIVAAMNAAGLPVTKKTRGSLLQLVQGTDAEGNATFSIVHKPSATSTQVTGEGLPAKTEGQLGREATDSRARYVQGEMNKRAATRGTGRSATGRSPTVDKTAHRRAAKLIGDIEQSRSFMNDADRRLGINPNDAAAATDRRNAQLAGERAAAELNALGVGYEAGPGEKGFPYYKEKQQSQDPKIRAYADRYFGGDYDAAVEAIRKQRGQ
jgi:hypothetical protein